MASTLGDCFAAVTSKLSGPQSRLSQNLYALKEFAAYLLGLHAPATEPSFGFCQQYQEFPSSLPSKNYPGPMLLNFSVPTAMGVSNMAWSDGPLCSFVVLLLLATRVFQFVVVRSG